MRDFSVGTSVLFTPGADDWITTDLYISGPVVGKVIGGTKYSVLVKFPQYAGRLHNGAGASRYDDCWFCPPHRLKSYNPTTSFENAYAALAD